VETATTTAPTPPPPPKPSALVVRIEISDGDVKGGLQTITVARGRRVTLAVRSDVTDQVHVHGLDVFQNVGPGRVTRVTVEPKIAGRYEIELEAAGLQIAQLNVEP
jgi:hypothetical protein